MARTPIPTEVQLRQHALDRALQPNVVAAVRATLGSSAGVTSKKVAEGVTRVAEVFVEYLRGDPDVVVGEPEANLGLATTRELFEELQSRMNRTVNDGGKTASIVGQLRRELDGKTLDYRPVDA